eukprot:1148443-Pelagomonas_calceolata.AAC.2
MAVFDVNSRSYLAGVALLLTSSSILILRSTRCEGGVGGLTCVVQMLQSPGLLSPSRVCLTFLAQLLFPTPPRLPQDVLSRHHSPCEFAGRARSNKDNIGAAGGGA